MDRRYLNAISTSNIKRTEASVIFIGIVWSFCRQKKLDSSVFIISIVLCFNFVFNYLCYNFYIISVVLFRSLDALLDQIFKMISNWSGNLCKYKFKTYVASYFLMWHLVFLLAIVSAGYKRKSFVERIFL